MMSCASSKLLFKRAIQAMMLGLCVFGVIIFSVQVQALTNDVSPIKEERLGDNPKLPTVAIVTMGGTIASKTDVETGAAVPAVSGKELVEAVPQLLELANIRLIDFLQLDSSQLTPKEWSALSELITKLVADQDITGVVVTHGTDTMAEGAYFVDLTTQSHKPIVFTGAMRSASDANPDGPANLRDAVLQATSKDAKDWGVTVTMNQYIHSARDVRKTHTSNIQAFESGERGVLGYIAQDKVKRYRDRLDRQYFPLPKEIPNVVLLTTYPGDNGDLMRSAIRNGAKGIVVQGFGSGNVGKDLFNAIQYALDRGIVVVITSQVQQGAVEAVYGGEGGAATLKEKGVIMAYDLSGPKARILLLLALPALDYDYEKFVQVYSK